MLTPMTRQDKPFDRKSYGKFFVSYYNELCAYANTMLRDDARAEDIVQDVFVGYWEKRDTIEVRTSLVSYFYSAVRNKCYNYLEHLRVERNSAQKIGKAAEEDAGTLSADDPDDPRIVKMREALDRLPLQCKRVVILSCIEGMKYNDIARELEISVNTVRTHISRAFSSIRKSMPIVIFMQVIVP